ncbi:hypothetical protein [Geminicoccus roseus]|uniref:hypothetical protein n=1 Tax=Geminicoccus roseus TaxID=404900 RepID=UPI0003F91762|nr:hypothetical protein [Geminicoccus roseus]
MFDAVLADHSPPKPEIPGLRPDQVRCGTGPDCGCLVQSDAPAKVVYLVVQALPEPAAEPTQDKAAP